jgi:signal transduction histidine kinase
MSVTSTSGRFAQVGVLTLTVAVFGVVVALVTLRLRSDLRQQIFQGWAENLGAVTSMQLDVRAADIPDDVLAQTGSLMVAVMDTQRLRNVTGAQVFAANGTFAGAFPGRWSEDPPAGVEWARLMAGEPIVRIHPGISSEDVILGLPPMPARRDIAVEMWVPLRRGGRPRVLGAAQFWMKGDPFAADMAAHDWRLWTQAAFAWLAGSAVIVLAMTWAFRRLALANAELRARSEDLQRANRELVLAAKTSALGAVTAHLMHELKNPLAGLESIVGGQSEFGGGAREPGGELAAASDLTRRLRTMVNDVVGVLRDEQTSAEFELTGADVAELVAEKVRPEANARGVKLEATGPAAFNLSGRRGNLATLVLRNLLQNAIEATPAGRAVRLSGRVASDGAAEFLVEDGGMGLPAEVRARLFQPCASTKAGGSGVGLALSQQLAQHAGGRLELVRSDERGTCFRLVLPAEP